MEKFVFLTDAHWGFERAGGHKVPLHDLKAINVAMSFIEDFKPNHVVLGGDMLDCGGISHHQKGSPGKLEGLRLLADSQDCRTTIIEPLEQMVKGKLVYIVGNHEDWLADILDDLPALEGIIDIASLLKLGKRWNMVPQGEAYKLGRLTFVHGDQVKGGMNPAKWAVDAYNRNIFFGHYHTHQAFTKVSALDLNGHTGTAVPCLCRKGPKYGGGSPNRWIQGFLYGYADATSFNAYVAIIINGRAIINGKVYKG